MRFLSRVVRLLPALCLAANLVVFAAAQEAARSPGTGKTPIVVIPGLAGSELVNQTSGRIVWFRSSRAKDDDIRLPLSPNLAENRDGLIPRDIIRGVQVIKILPEIEIYRQLIATLQERGYREVAWDSIKEGDHQDTFLVFPYDWRRDNVESARLLIKRLESFKQKVGRRELRLNIIAHSMGGLISRYAAMYGDSDIPAGEPKPSWAGANHIHRVFLLGTPNEGSILSLNAMLNGYSYLGGGVRLPFVPEISRFDIFTIPSIFQLLPHKNSLLAYDEELKPLKLDIFNPATWDEYDWSIWKDKNFEKRFSMQEQENARLYFRAALKRASEFQAALNASSDKQSPVSFYLIGADCKDTQDALLLYRDEKRDRWKTIFKPQAFTRSDGRRVTPEELRPLLLAKGDGVVTRRSLSGESGAKDGMPAALPVVSELFQCESHGKLVSNPEIQEKLFGHLHSALAGPKVSGSNRPK